METITPKYLSDKVPGLSQNLAGKYLRGFCKPSLERAIEIERCAGIPIRAWLDISAYLNNHSRTKDAKVSRADKKKNTHKETA